MPTRPRIRTQAAPRLAVICDLAEENWPSMDLVADALLTNLRENHAHQISALRVRPQMNRRMTSLPIVGNRWAANNADRLLNRLWDYPRWLQRRVNEFNLFHLCDHSYSQLLHVLPGERAGVFCHDLDTFRCLLEPEAELRPRWFRKMAEHILRGLQRAAVVFYTTGAVRQQIERYGLIDPARLVQAPYGTSPEFNADSKCDNSILSGVTDLKGAPFLLHVGSCIARKRIDVLLDVFAEINARHPDIKLVQVGGEWTAAQVAQLNRLKISASVFQLARQNQRTIAALYRQAAAVLIPSEAEGFGLPVIEALACGSVVVASDIPVLREVGGEAVIYCALGDIADWAESLDKVLCFSEAVPDFRQRRFQANLYSWDEHARIISNTYQRLL